MIGGAYDGLGQRGLIDRLRKGNWFEHPSHASIACRQTGPIVIGDIERDEASAQVAASRQDS